MCMRNVEDIFKLYGETRITDGHAIVPHFTHFYKTVFAHTLFTSK